MNGCQGELNTVGTATQNAREPRIVFDLETTRRRDSCERSEPEAMYGVTDELRYELKAVERPRNASLV
jgi:hypothetical protein